LVSKKIDTVEDLKKFWEDKLEEAKDRHAGDIPGELMRAIEKLLGVKVDWKQELRKMMSSLSSKSDYFLPNRRFLATGAQWGSKKKKESFESLVIIADTSGSVSQKELEQFVSEAMDIMESFKPKETFLIWCDTTVYEPVDVIKKGETWNYRKAYGGGGTSFIPPVVWIEENIIKKGKKLGPVLFFTDGEPNTGPNGGWPQETEYSIRSYVNKFFWIILGEGGVPRKHVKVPFGKRIDLIM
jgi:predicted metal-dependent peptidase